MTKTDNWETTCNRFVAFFDILGFKDLVLKSTHEDVLSKLVILKDTISNLEGSEIDGLKKRGVTKDQTRAVTFSDSLIFFSKSDSFCDAIKIFFDAHHILTTALINGIAIKGAISYGEITVDFEKSLFFGQPIIDAFLLHEDLKMLTVVIDNKTEVKLNSFEDRKIEEVVTEYKAYFKTGRITHKILRPSSNQGLKTRTESIKKLYITTSGVHRIYFDNTLDFLNSLTY